MSHNVMDIALEIAVKAHVGKVDHNGEPTILHPLAVGLMGVTDEEKVTGFLIDAVAESGMTFDDLLAKGIPASTVNALKVLAYDGSGDYLTYIRSIVASRNPVALMVKEHDLRQRIAESGDDVELKAKLDTALGVIAKAAYEQSQVHAYVRHSGNALAVFACGCFWGVQHQFSREPGVTATFAGYTGGSEEDPAYADVRGHRTGHVEAVAVEYDPAATDYRQLCHVFFEIHDPAQTDGSGPDLGPQYRSCLFYADEQQHSIADEVIADLRSRGYEVNTLLLPLGTFYVAEDWHQDYYDRTGGEPYCHIREKKF